MALCRTLSIYRRGFYPHFHKNLNFLRAASITKWNKDWKPGPYPRTEEERLAAAKKYNLIPEDYKPYPEEEGYGDYPDLPPVSAEARNPYELFDYPHLRKNYGEPLHTEFDMYGADRINLAQRRPMSYPKMFLFQIGMVAFFGGLIWLGDAFPREIDRVGRQYPNMGVTHYSFEVVEEENS